MDYNQILQLFQAEMSANGIAPPKDIVADSKLHRFHVEGDKTGSKNGWYVLYLDGISCGVFGSWKKGNYFKWSSKSKNLMTAAERNQQREKIKEACKIRDEMKKKEQDEASLRAEDLWYSSRRADSDHPYPFFMLAKVVRQSYYPSLILMRNYGVYNIFLKQVINVSYQMALSKHISYQYKFDRVIKKFSFVKDSQRALH